MVKQVVSENFYEAIKSACGAGIVIRSTVMMKYKRGLNLENVCDG